MSFLSLNHFGFPKMNVMTLYSSHGKRLGVNGIYSKRLWVIGIYNKVDQLHGEKESMTFNCKNYSLG